MKKYLFLTICLAALFMTGCTASYHQINVGHIDSGTKLEINKSVFISTPKDGFYGNSVQNGSGQMTAQAVKAAFSRFTNKIKLSADCNDIEPCIKAAKEANYDYLVFPEVLHWEERATEWSGLPDRIEIKLSLYAIPSNKQISSIIIKGKSKWATFGGDHPQDLLPKPINNYVSTLYK